jgi:hypothetical protein
VSSLVSSARSSGCQGRSSSREVSIVVTVGPYTSGFR